MLSITFGRLNKAQPGCIPVSELVSRPTSWDTQQYSVTSAFLRDKFIEFGMAKKQRMRGYEWSMLAQHDRTLLGDVLQAFE